MSEIKFEIEKELGKISGSARGWTKELNIVSSNGKQAKYDLRDWAPEHEKMGKGITLSIEEIRELRDLLNYMDLNQNSENSNVIIADVLYTKTDETFYVLNGLSKSFNKYKSGSMKESIKLLQEDNWVNCGKVNRADDSLVDMFVRNNEYIAIWEK